MACLLSCTDHQRCLSHSLVPADILTSFHIPASNSSALHVSDGAAQDFTQANTAASDSEN